MGITHSQGPQESEPSQVHIIHTSVPTDTVALSSGGRNSLRDTQMNLRTELRHSGDQGRKHR